MGGAIYWTDWKRYFIGKMLDRIEKLMAAAVSSSDIYHTVLAAETLQETDSFLGILYLWGSQFLEWFFKSTK